MKSEGTNKDLGEIEQLFYSHHKILCNVANNILGDGAAAEDIVQEVFLKLWRKRNEIKIESTLKGYLYKSVTNASLDYIQKSKRIELREEIKESEGETVEIFLNEPSENTLEKYFNEALDGLPPKCRAIFVLSRFEGLRHKEIAEQLDISINTVETQMGIALDRLRKFLKPYLNKGYLVSSITISSFLTFNSL